MRLSRIVLAVALVVGVLTGAHYYLWKRLVWDPALPEPWLTAGTGLLAVLLLALPASFFVPRLLPPRAAAAVLWPLWSWMGVAFLLLVLLGVAELVGLFADPSPRIVAATAFGGAAVLTVAGLVSALGAPRLREVHVPVDGLPRSLAGTTIVQLSDVHVDALVDLRWVERVVARVNRLSPDLVVITGDLVDGTVAQLSDRIAPIADLRARWGTFFVTGNHEYYGGGRPVDAAEEWIAHLETLGIRTLRNEHVTLGEGDARWVLAGVYDASAGSFGGRHRPDVPAALAGREPGLPVVLLAHQPKTVREAAPEGVDLQLSGHTHDGQIWPFRYLVFLQQPYVEGLVRHGRTWLFVSRGTGFWGPPMRLLAPAEITKVVLEPGPLAADRT